MTWVDFSTVLPAWAEMYVYDEINEPLMMPSLQDETLETGSIFTSAQISYPIDLDSHPIDSQTLPTFTSYKISYPTFPTFTSNQNSYPIDLQTVQSFKSHLKKPKGKKKLHEFEKFTSVFKNKKILLKPKPRGSYKKLMTIEEEKCLDLATKGLISIKEMHHQIGKSQKVQTRKNDLKSSS